MIPSFFKRQYDKLVGNDIIELTFTVQRKMEIKSNSDLSASSGKSTYKCESLESVQSVYDSIVRWNNLYTSQLTNQSETVKQASSYVSSYKINGYKNDENIDMNFDDIDSLKEFLINKNLIQAVNSINTKNYNMMK